jgi:hypothetical protein
LIRTIAEAVGGHDLPGLLDDARAVDLEEGTKISIRILCSRDRLGI